jgi:type I restriction enzyme, S subunit
MSGWEYVKIGDVLKTTSGGTPLKSKKEYYQGGTIPWLKSGEVRQLEVTKSKHFITPLGLKNSSAKFFPAETVLFALYGATAGQVGVLKFEATTNQAICGIFPSEAFDSKFLCYCLRSQYEQIVAQAVGNAQPNLSQKKVRDLSVPMLPLAEQKRIVSILDEAFGAIAKAKENAERNLANAKELFESYLNKVFTEKGEGWEERKFGDENIVAIIDGDRGVNYPKKNDFSDAGFCLFMNTKNVRPDGLNFDSSSFITKKKDDAMRKGKLQRNDVVITTRGTVGNLGVYSDEVPYDHIRINSGMLILRPNPKELDSWYLFTVLRSGYFRSQMHRNITGAAQPQLPIKTLVKLKVAIPGSLTVQKQIVDEARRFSRYSERLRSGYQEKLTDLDELKQSILQKAFTGQLTSKTSELQSI